MHALEGMCFKSVILMRGAKTRALFLAALGKLHTVVCQKWAMSHSFTEKRIVCQFKPVEIAYFKARKILTHGFWFLITVLGCSHTYSLLQVCGNRPQEIQLEGPKH
jgi:hypothetical protein